MRKHRILTLASVILALLQVTPVLAQDEEEQQPSGQPQGFKAYSKYDFIPGDKVLFFEDFSQDAIADFPARWNTNGSGEVVTLEGFPGKWFKMVPGGTFFPEGLPKFPENYTVEFDLVYERPEEGNDTDFPFEFVSWIEGEEMDALVPGNGGFGFSIEAFGVKAYNWVNYDNGEIQNFQENDILDRSANKKSIRVSVWIQKQRGRLYLDEKKVYDIPRLVISGLTINRLRFAFWGGNADNTFYISNLRVAGGIPDMRNKLLTEGKLVTYGIYFDSGSDKVKPESYGTLKEIAAVLNENQDLKIKIVGHTDSDGNDASNLDLSRRRAGSVKKMLSDEFSVNADRMEADGKGETEPISGNNTSEGKALNRRVEFIRL